MTDINYIKLRLDVLENLITSRGIECNNNKTDMIRHLILYDEGKYVKESTIEKYGSERFLIGVDCKKKDLFVRLGKLVEKNEAKFIYFSCGRHYYISNINILKDEVD